MVNFTHRYFKLDHIIFPTVRSTGYVEKHSLQFGGQIPIYIAKAQVGWAILLKEEQKAIEEMNIAFLRFDASSPRTHIGTHQDYIDLLNSFLPEGWGRTTGKTIKSILWMRWTKRLPQ